MCPRTTEQAESKVVTYNSTGVVSPEGNRTSRRTISEMMVPKEPSNRRRPIGGIEMRVRLLVVQNTGSAKQSDEPESMRARKSDGICGDCRSGHKEFGSVGAEALSRKKESGVRSGVSSRPLGRTDVQESLLSFPTAKQLLEGPRYPKRKRHVQTPSS